MWIEVSESELDISRTQGKLPPSEKDLDNNALREGEMER